MWRPVCKLMHVYLRVVRLRKNYAVESVPSRHVCRWLDGGSDAMNRSLKVVKFGIAKE
jgi:hypothetical protein